MASKITEHPGNEAGRVTILTTLNSLIAPFFTIAVVVALAVLEIIDREVAGAIVLGMMAQAGLTTGAVYKTAKQTKTDRADIVWGTPPAVPVGSVSVDSSSPRHAAQLAGASAPQDASVPADVQAGG